MSAAGERTAERIARGGREALIARLHAAFARQAAASTVVTLDADELAELVTAAVGRAGGPLWRRCLAEAATAELRIDLSEAVSHPAVLRAHELVAAPVYEIPPAANPAPARPDPAHAAPADPAHAAPADPAHAAPADPAHAAPADPAHAAPADPAHAAPAPQRRRNRPRRRQRQRPLRRPMP